jgi:hypothetical protein
VTKFILDRPVDLFKLESKNTVHTRLTQTDKSAVKENSINQGLIIKLLEDTKLLSAKTDSTGKPLNWECTHTT